MSDYPRLFQCAHCGSRGALFEHFQECTVCGAPIDDETVFCDGEEDVFETGEEEYDDKY